MSETINISWDRAAAFQVLILKIRTHILGLNKFDNAGDTFGDAHLAAEFNAFGKSVKFSISDLADQLAALNDSCTEYFTIISEYDEKAANDARSAVASLLAQP